MEKKRGKSWKMPYFRCLRETSTRWCWVARIIPMIEQIVGENVRVIDPAPAVAKQTNRLLETGRLVNPTSAGGNVKLFTSGNVKALQSLLPILLGESAVVNNAEWIDKTHIRQAHGFTTPTQA
jgi:hypothetical protein